MGSPSTTDSRPAPAGRAYSTVWGIAGEDEHGPQLIYWTRFLCYCLNVLHLEESELFEKHGVRFAAGQRESLGSLWEHLQNGDWSEEALEEELLEISASFWMQRLQGDPFASPLWHFFGVLGIDGGTLQFRPAHLFTYVLAGLTYVGRALLGEWAIPTKDRPDVRDTWLCKATYSPMGYTLSLLLYGRAIAKQTGSRLMISWSKTSELMYFTGKPVLMDDIRKGGHDHGCRRPALECADVQGGRRRPI
ncbi:hypothetical protein O988_02743 [Pseudogymnoascus sp. VKM F-3808]|nr:hypothetical protein O988_02743 [Pseudogymnoascus sp. VKM F-3808]